MKDILEKIYDHCNESAFSNGVEEFEDHYMHLYEEYCKLKKKHADLEKAYVEMRQAYLDLLESDQYD